MNAAPFDLPVLPFLASLGQIAFVGVYVLLLAGLVCLPKSLWDANAPPVPWWKNLRFWAAVICGVQILVYAALG